MKINSMVFVIKLVTAANPSYLWSAFFLKTPLLALRLNGSFALLLHTPLGGVRKHTLLKILDLWFICQLSGVPTDASKTLVLSGDCPERYAYPPVGGAVSAVMSVYCSTLRLHGQPGPSLSLWHLSHSACPG